jgi:hypothetical protein
MVFVVELFVVPPNCMDHCVPLGNPVLVKVAL